MNTLEKLKEMLREGEVQFSYLKKDSTVREARGTVNLDIIPEENHPKGESERKISDQTVRYYDLDSCGWRSFSIENLIDIKE